jgi:hypothetical protein
MTMRHAAPILVRGVTPTVWYDPVPRLIGALGAGCNHAPLIF